MRRVVIACKTVEAELRALLPADVDLRCPDQGLHRAPDMLREALQREIDAADADEILLGYGCCGTGVVGLTAAKARLILPRVDDCIAMLLGSDDRYRREFQREPGTYWLSHGWIEHAESDPYQEYRRCVAKYGEETARWVTREMMKGYRRLALIDTGASPLSPLADYAREFAAFFDLRYEELPGGPDLLRDLLAPDRRDGRFVTVEPGQAVSARMFLPALGSVNLGRNSRG